MRHVVVLTQEQLDAANRVLKASYAAELVPQYTAISADEYRRELHSRQTTGKTETVFVYNPDNELMLGRLPAELTEEEKAALAAAP